MRPVYRLLSICNPALRPQPLQQRESLRVDRNYKCLVCLLPKDRQQATGEIEMLTAKIGDFGLSQSKCSHELNQVTALACPCAVLLFSHVPQDRVELAPGGRAANGNRGPQGLDCSCRVIGDRLSLHSQVEEPSKKAQVGVPSCACQPAMVFRQPSPEISRLDVGDLALEAELPRATKRIDQAAPVFGCAGRETRSGFIE